MTLAWESWSPWDMFSRAILIPASYIFCNISYNSVAGPIVQIMRVFCMRAPPDAGLSSLVEVNPNSDDDLTRQDARRTGAIVLFIVGQVHRVSKKGS